MACWNTFGISSGRFKIDSVTPVMKYHVFEGRCGYVLMDCSREGVMMDGRIAGVMFHSLQGLHTISSMRKSRLLPDTCRELETPLPLCNI